MAFDVIQGTLASAVATSGTFTVPYPTNRDDGDYAGGFDHKLICIGATFTAVAGQISLSFGASVITITYNGSTTLPANSAFYLQVDKVGGDSDKNPLADPGKMTRGEIVKINLGAPLTADPNGVCESQSGSEDTAMTIAGALATGGVAYFDVPRNVVAAWTGTAVLTVTGTDVYGETIVESSASGTSMAGKKAFKTVTSVVPSADTTSHTVGTGDVIGLPVRLAQAGDVLAELEDGAAATAGTTVAGVTTAATATTGDVRGTYDPDSACDGAKDFQLVAWVPDASYKGVPQYGG